MKAKKVPPGWRKTGRTAAEDMNRLTRFIIPRAGLKRKRKFPPPEKRW